MKTSTFNSCFNSPYKTYGPPYKMYGALLPLNTLSYYYLITILISTYYIMVTQGSSPRAFCSTGEGAAAQGCPPRCSPQRTPKSAWPGWRHARWRRSTSQRVVIKTTEHRFDSYWSFDPEHDVKRLTRVLAQWKRVWLITKRSVDRNH